MMETGVCRLAFRNIRRYWSVLCIGTDLARNFADALAAWVAQLRIDTPFAVSNDVGGSVFIPPRDVLILSGR